MMRAEKELAVKVLVEKFQKAKGAVLAEYRGLKVSEITEIRKEIKKESGDFSVVKNRLARMAVRGSEWSSLEEHFKGPIALAISNEDPVVLTKILSKYAATFASLKIKVGCLDGRLVDEKGVESLAKLPSKEELYAKLLGTLIAPAQSVVRALNGVPQKLVIALKAIGEKK